MYNPAEGYVRTVHSVRGLPRVVCHITGHNAEGKSVFLSTDGGDHHHELVSQSAIANIIYSTNQHPVELNGDVGINYTHENEPESSVKNGSVCRMIDFAPGEVSPMQPVNSLAYAIVIEGVFRMILDSGEERILQRGDIAIQRSTAHKWVNVTGDGLVPARILFVPLNINSSPTGSEKVHRKLGLPRRNSLWLPSHETRDEPDRGRLAKFYENGFWESEF